MVRLDLCIVGFLGMVAAGKHHHHGHNASAAEARRSVITSKTGEELVRAEDLPSAFDWRSHGGKSWVTSDMNQHIPVYCGSCWIHGTTGALNDRLKIQRRGRYPDVMLSRQVMMNCVQNPEDNTTPGCDGGDPWWIYAHLHATKIPDESCQAYVAETQKCTPFNTCRQCLPQEQVFKPEDLVGINATPDGCFAIEPWSGYGVGDYGGVKGEVAMMKEIYARGPITCGIAVDTNFVEDYAANANANEGVYVQEHPYNASMINHDVEVAGWGVTPSGAKYWVVRNSWGTYWGENGWFRVQKGANQLALESDCSWAVPTADDLEVALSDKVLGDYLVGPHKPGMWLAAGVELAADPPRPTSQVPVAAASFVAGLAVAGLSFKASRGVRQRPLLG